MNKTSLTLYSILFIGFACLIFAVFAFFLVTDPALALIKNPAAPTQEVLWASMNIPRPAYPPPQATLSVPATTIPTVEVAAPTEETTSSRIDPVADEGSFFPDDGRWIDVNLSQQQIYAYEGDTLVNSFIVSTGLPDTPTVTGEYRIYVKVPLQDMSGPGYYLTDVPWVMFFYEDYGFHGTYWHNNFGTPMSRGCINLSVEDASWLYGWASVGTPVSIHY